METLSSETDESVWKAATSMGKNRTILTIIWTGTVAIVCGGSTKGETIANQFEDQTIFEPESYNPLTYTWNDITGHGLLNESRRNHSSIWTGTEMIIWGGRIRVGGCTLYSNGFTANLPCVYGTLWSTDNYLRNGYTRNH